MYKQPTEAAKELKKKIESHGLRVLAEVDDGYKRIDLSIPAAKMNIEVDGLHHLYDPEQINCDLNRSHHSGRLGYSTIHIQNDYIYLDLDRVAAAIAGAAKLRVKQINSNN